MIFQASMIMFHVNLQGSKQIQLEEIGMRETIPNDPGSPKLRMAMEPK